MKTYQRYMLSLLLAVISSCASSIAPPNELKEIFAADCKRTAHMTLRPSMKYMGVKGGQHYIKYNLGGLGAQKVYRLHSSQVRSDINLEYSENATDWIPCSLKECGSDSKAYRIIERKVRKVEGIKATVSNIITC